MTRRKKYRFQKKRGKKIAVKKQFAKAMYKLRRMKAKNQRAAAIGASNEFIRDISGFFKKIRSQPHLVKPAHRRILKKHQKKLRKLVHAKTPIHRKKFILSQKGGILPALIPVICALIGAGGGIAGAATSAAIIKS